MCCFSERGLQPDGEGDTHDSLPGEAAGGVEQTVLVLGPPVAIDILLADLALGPATVGGAGLVGVHGDVFHCSNLLFCFLLRGVPLCVYKIAQLLKHYQGNREGSLPKVCMGILPEKWANFS